MKTFDQALEIVKVRINNDIKAVQDCTLDASNNEWFRKFLIGQYKLLLVSTDLSLNLARLDCLFNLGVMVGIEMEKQEISEEILK